MSKVVYLLGAGASFGKRISKAEEIKADLSSTYKCNFLGADNKQ